MNKLYIFITFDIFGMGGGQAYVASKATFLKQIGWDVLVLCCGVPIQKSQFKELNNYFDGCFPELAVQPARLPKHAINKVIKKIKKLAGEHDTDDTIIVESHDDVTSQWGEIIAQDLRAKHIFILMNEIYRGQGKVYADKIDFYKFKFYRKEIMGPIEVLGRLFQDFMDDIDTDYVNPFIIDEEPVQDVYNEKIAAIQKLDYNICYIGRTTKPYVKSILQGIKAFASRYSNTQFILIGDPKPIRYDIDDIQNANVIELGEVVPIPRDLYKKIDVVIAGSGSARCSAYEGALTIVADPELCKSIGILGYDTQESVYWDGKSEILSFEDALENVLIRKAYEGISIYYPKTGVDKCTAQNFEAISRSSNIQEYYDIEKLIDGRKFFYPLYYLKFFIKRNADKVPYFYRLCLSIRNTLKSKKS